MPVRILNSSALSAHLIGDQMKRLKTIAYLTALLVTLSGCRASSGHEHPMETHLQHIVAGHGTEDLTITYTDMHGLWGGVTINLTREGDYERTRRLRGGAAPEFLRGRVAPERVTEMMRLLLELKTWEQRVPERVAAHDESRALLTIRSGSEESSVWEWYNDLAKNQRLGRVREHLLQLGNKISSNAAPN